MKTIKVEIRFEILTLQDDLRLPCAGISEAVTEAINTYRMHRNVAVSEIRTYLTDGDASVALTS